MATRLGIDSSIVNKLGADHQELFFAIKAEFDTSDIRLWTGKDDLTISSETYTGAGTLLAISSIEDDKEVTSNGVNISLSGMDSTVLNYALTENYQNRPITIFLGYQIAGTNEVAGTITMFKGRMVTLSIVDSPEGSTVSIDCENRLTDLDKPSHFRYTKESQEFLFAGDKGLDRVASLQDKEILWGRTSTGSGSMSGGGGGGSSEMDDIRNRFPAQEK